MLGPKVRLPPGRTNGCQTVLTHLETASEGMLPPEAASPVDHEIPCSPPGPYPSVWPPHPTHWGGLGAKLRAPPSKTL